MSVPPESPSEEAGMILFDKVTKTYRKTSRPALDQVGLEVERGEFVFVVGQSGSGKSTLIRLVLREEHATAGAVLVAGRDLRRLPERRVPMLRREIGTVFQDFRLLPNKNVYHNVAFALQVIGRSRSAIRQTVPETLEIVGLDDKAKRMPARAVRRGAAAGGYRPRVRQPAGDPDRRRADRQPRPDDEPSTSCSCSNGSTAPAPRSSWQRTTTRSSTDPQAGRSSSTAGPRARPGARRVRQDDLGHAGDPHRAGARPGAGRGSGGGSRQRRSSGRSRYAVSRARLGAQRRCEQASCWARLLAVCAATSPWPSRSSS